MLLGGEEERNDRKKWITAPRGAEGGGEEGGKKRTSYSWARLCPRLRKKARGKKLVYVKLLYMFLLAFAISSEPICEVVTPESVFPPERNCETCFVGEIARNSTCSGISWFHGDEYIATVHFEAGSLCTYQVNRAATQCILRQTILLDQELVSGDHLTMNSEGNWMAVTVNHRQQIHLFRVDRMTHRIDPEPAYSIRNKDPNVHGVRFSRNGQFLLTTAIRGRGRIAVYQLDSSMAPISYLHNKYHPLKPKSLDFSHDDEYLAVVYAANVTKVPIALDGLIAIYRFDKGRIDPEPISTYIDEDFKGGEDIRFYPDDSALFVSDHGQNRILVYRFHNGKIGGKIAQLENPTSRLSFPHGIAVSENGKFLAVTNYGHDNFAIYSISSD